jgi:tRNA nucleotidyltransferase (CCA-adding enzyme)
MKVYLVGGSVRDTLMGLEPHDRDYVVCGSTPEELLSLGFKQCGQDFPVFLHPQTNEEYALARTETKDGVGYQGFNCQFGPEVTLEEDLSRRDLTINAIAQDIETGEIIDPFNGQQDIKDKILRATTDSFKEDPLRVLRLARFLAKFGPEWDVSTKTEVLVNDLWRTGEIQTLTPERIWLETVKAFNTKHPSLYFNYLDDMGVFPEYDQGVHHPQPVEHHPEIFVGNHIDLVMDYAAQNFNDPEITFACLCHDMGKHPTYTTTGKFHGHEQAGLEIVTQLCDRLKVPKSFRELALMTTEFHTHSHKAFEMKPKSIMSLFEKTNAITKTERFEKFLKACKADSKGRGEPRGSDPYPQSDFLKECLLIVKAVDTKLISSKMLAEGKSGHMIGEAIRVARINAIRKFKKEWK